jgi:IclR family transcriptional regulator, pca regulon regulatory protein
MPRVKPSTLKIDDNGEWVQSVPVLRESRYSQSVERGLAILGCFTAERPVLGIFEIADELGMSRSSTHRYASTLVALGYLEQDRRRRYGLALAVCGLGMSALCGMALAENARPCLEDLCGRTGYTVSLGILDGPEVLCVDRVQGFRRGRRQAGLGLEAGSRLPAYCTALGKLLLAYLPESEQRRVLREIRLVRRTPQTITSRQSLRDELEGIREGALAVCDEELARGVYAIAVGVRDSREVIAALSMTAHSPVIDVEGLVGLAPHLIATADQISARLGYRREDERHRSAGSSLDGQYAGEGF